MSDNPFKYLAIGAGFTLAWGVCIISVPVLRGIFFANDHVDVDHIVFGDEPTIEQEVFSQPSISYYPQLAIPNNLFSSTDKSSVNNFMHSYRFSMSIEVFDQSLQALAQVAKWPRPQFKTTRHRQETERLAHYLMGVAETYMINGPTSIQLTEEANLSVSLLYLCAANLGLPEAFKRNNRFGTKIIKHSKIADRLSTTTYPHATSNKIMTLSELVVLFMFAIEEMEDALLWIAKLVENPRAIVFKCYALLALGRIEEFQLSLLSLMKYLPENHEAVELILSSSQANLMNFDLALLASYFPENLQRLNEPAANLE